MTVSCNAPPSSASSLGFSWQSPRVLYLFLTIFTLSGFSGLIYESIWTHYLKLFLGHAAYAQTLVLSIFMGGMAIGAWIAGRYISKLSNALIAYGWVEGFIGLFALIFHVIFNQFLDFSYERVMPHISSVWGIHLYKWITGALLILPQSILLGATFPLMSAGLIQRLPNSSGRVLGLLYFTNSFGAAVGVLTNGFILVQLVGLQGSMIFAGLINLVLALVVSLLAKKTTSLPICNEIISNKQEKRDENTSSVGISPSVCPLFFIVLFTGLASFMYEIGWIRMLSLVLGSSTHSFEVMLSAFILGLAIGGFIIRNHADRFKNPLHMLGRIQVTMGIFALLTLLFYKTQAFAGMSTFLSNIKRTEETYLLFNLYSFILAVIIMLPATICAGMVLPLITNILYKKGSGAGVIGRIYAWNTFGSILGVFVAVQLVMPAFGVKQVIVIGAAIDILLGLVLLKKYAPIKNNKKRKELIFAAIFSLSFIGFFAAYFQFNSNLLASGIYRYGVVSNDLNVVYHKDGKTASVDVLKSTVENNYYLIKTNGKTDAGLYTEGKKYSGDETTMILLGALPLDYAPESKLIANIGFGSGLTVHTVLESQKLISLDTIEIEPAMVNGARFFEKRVYNAFNDPRNHIHYEDAKTFFSQNNKKYDVIISEPSNPWVSGVSSLFTDEFYRHAKRYLQPDGLFVQWLQLYEIDINLVASVMKGLNKNFDDYVVYQASAGDIIILAKPKGMLPERSGTIFENPKLKQALTRINIASAENLTIRMVGKKQALAPLFDSFDVRMNSDYFPVIDQHAVKSRFLDHNALDMTRLVLFTGIVDSLFQLNERKNDARFIDKIKFNPSSEVVKHAMTIKAINDYYTKGTVGNVDVSIQKTALELINSLNAIQYLCDETYINNAWFANVKAVMFMGAGLFNKNGLDAIFKNIESGLCFSKIDSTNKTWLEIFRAINYRDDQRIVNLTEVFMQTNHPDIQLNYDYLLALRWLSLLNLNQSTIVLTEWKNKPQAHPNLMLRLLVAQAYKHANLK